MILFISGQYAGAQYLHPILEKWSVAKFKTKKWNLIATGTSCNYWRQTKIDFNEISEYSYNKVSTYIDLVKPKLIITSASSNIDLEYFFILVAKKKSIPVISFIDIWSNYLPRFKYKEELIFPDFVFAIDNRCKKEMIEEGIPKNLIKIIGQPYLESIVKNIQPLGNKILFASQPVKKYYENKLGYNENNFWEICSKVIKKIGKENILCTIHPDEQLDKLKNSLFFPLKNGRGFKDILDSHTVLGMFSMQIIVGYLWGRKVASIIPDNQKFNQSPLSRWNLIPTLNNPDKIIEFVNKKEDLTNKHRFKEILLDRHKELGILGSIKRFELFLQNF